MPEGARDAVLLGLHVMLMTDERLKQFETSYSRYESPEGKITSTIVCYVEDQAAANEILAMVHAETPMIGQAIDRTLSTGKTEEFTIRVYVTPIPKIVSMRTAPKKKGKK